MSVKEDRDDILIYKSIDLSRLSRTTLLGLPVDNVTRDEALSWMLHALEQKIAPRHILFLDPIKLFRLRFNPKLKSIVKEASLILADGGALLWASRKLGKDLKERIPMMAVILDLMRLAMYNDFTVYLMGFHREHVNEVFFNFQRNFPSLRVIGRHAGSPSKEQISLVKESLRKSAPDIILLGMEFPHQELWVTENKKYLGNAVILGVDDSFEVLSGLSKKKTRLGTNAWTELALVYDQVSLARQSFFSYIVFLSVLIYQVFVCRKEKRNKF